MPKKMVDIEIVKVTTVIPSPLLEELRKLIEIGEYRDIAECLRAGIRMLIQDARERGLIDEH